MQAYSPSEVESSSGCSDQYFSGQVSGFKFQVDREELSLILSFRGTRNLNKREQQTEIPPTSE
jgi:hypothetical protein